MVLEIYEPRTDGLIRTVTRDVDIDEYDNRAPGGQVSDGTG